HLTGNLFLSSSAWYSNTEIDHFSATTDIYQPPLDQDGREQAQAPKYQYASSARYNVTDELYAMLGVEANDDYYFSDSHNAQAQNTN
ncbi:TonB-dependent receptor, partial [Pseudoalteromonas sp. SIMBA_153]